MSYPIEIRLAPKSVYFTPAEARAYYGRYSREGQATHWWGDGTGANNHDNIVNYFLRATEKSVNYVVSDNKITLMVSPDNVAWTTQSGNAITISVEHQPTLGAEGYKKSGWLLWQLEQRYVHALRIYPHKYFFSTSCPGTISTDRIRQEADKWARGAYNPQPTPAPAPTPTPTPINIVYERFPAPVEYVCNKQPTNLWNFNTNSWTGFTVVKPFNKGERITIVGKATHALGGIYLMTAYSFDKKIRNGFNQADMDRYQAPAPPPTPEWQKNRKAILPITKLYTLNNAKLVDVNTMAVIKTFPLDTPMDIKGETRVAGNEFYFTTSAFDENRPQGFLKADLKTTVTAPAPVEPAKPEWEKNLQLIDETHYWLAADANLVDITTGKDVQPIKSFKKDAEFVAKGKTLVNGVSYVITQYSLSKKIYNGLPIGVLTLTEPGVPNIQPNPVAPAEPNLNERVSSLEKIIKSITDFLDKMFSNWKK